ncbi:MAG: CHAT domain-containing protein [Pseudomonadota bacterium]
MTVTLCALLVGFFWGEFAAAQTTDNTHSDSLTANIERYKAAGDWQQASALVLSVFSSDRIDQLANDEALSLYNTGVELLAALDDADGSRLLDESALAEFSQRNYQTGILSARLSLASVAFWERELDDALPMVEALIDDTKNSAQFAEQYLGALVLRGHAYRFDSDYDNCIELLTPLLAAPQDDFANATSNTLFLVNRVLSLCHRNRGVANDWDNEDLSKAEAFAEAAAKHIERDPESQPLDRAIAWDTRARTYWEMGDKENAVAFERRAVTELETAGLDVGRDYALLAGLLSVYLTRSDKAGEALIYGERAVAAARAHYLRAFFGPRAAAYDDRYYLLYATNAYFESLGKLAAAGNEISANQLDAAFQYAQYTATSDIGSALKQVAIGASTRSDDIRRYLDTQQDLRDRWRQLSSEVALLATESTRYANALAQKRIERAAVAKQLTNLHDDASTDVRTYLGLWDTDSVSLAEMQQALDDDEVYFIITGIFSYVTVIAVTSRDIHWHRPDFARDEFCDLARQHRRSLSVMTDLDCNNRIVAINSTFQPLSPFDPIVAHDLYARLFEPAIKALGNKPNWIVSATGIASTIALPALLTDRTPLNDDQVPAFATLPWLGKQKALFMSPKASAFVVARSNRASDVGSADRLQVTVAGAPCVGEYSGGNCAAKMSAAAAADPPTRVAMVTRRGAVNADYSRLPALPGAAAELRRISHTIDNVTQLIGPTFNRKQLLQTLKAPGDVLVLSTHALADAESNLDEPALVLSPSGDDEHPSNMLLPASDIAQLVLPYDWVVLAGCHTGSPDGDPRAEVFTGLALAFLQAGSKAVLVSTFELLDSTSATIIPAVLAAYASDRNVNKAEALRLAIAELLANSENRLAHHPSQWAPYAVVGTAPQ